MAPFSALPRRIRKGHDTHVEFQALLRFKVFAPGQFDFVRNNIEIGRCRTKNHHAGASPLTKLFECVLDLDQIPSGTERPYPANGISIVGRRMYDRISVQVDDRGKDLDPGRPSLSGPGCDVLIACDYESSSSQ